MRIIIPGNPIAKARPKFCVRGRQAMAYDPQAKLMAEKRAELSFIAKQDQQEDFEGLFNASLIVRLWFHMPVQENASKVERNAKLNGLIRPAIKPDIDNLIKLVLDISNGQLWHDDSQIVELHAYQQYSENPCTIIEIEDIKINMNEDSEKFLRLFSPTTLEKFESDVSCLRVSLEALRLTHRSDREKNLEAASAILKDFANTYALALKKMASK